MTIRKEAFDRVSYDRARYLANAETIKARRKEHYEKNRERILKQQKQYRANNSSGRPVGRPSISVPRETYLQSKKIARVLGVSRSEARKMLGASL